MVEKAKKGAQRPTRYQVERQCGEALSVFCRALLNEDLPESDMSIGTALQTLRDLGPVRQHVEGASLVQALGRVGVVVEEVDRTVEDARECPLMTCFYPARIRQTYPDLPSRLSPRYAVRLDSRPPLSHAALTGGKPLSASRYPTGISERDELRMQTEILRLNLEGVGLSVNDALNELGAGLGRPLGEVSERCDEIALALCACGLRFHPVMKWWRLPRPGVLVLSEPERLLRGHPSVAFFQPEYFRGLVVVDRPERAGKAVNQGLLF